MSAPCSAGLIHHWPATLNCADILAFLRFPLDFLADKLERIHCLNRSRINSPRVCGGSSPFFGANPLKSVAYNDFTDRFTFCCL